MTVGRVYSRLSALSMAELIIRIFLLPAYGGSLFDPDRYPFLEGPHA